MKKLKMLIKFQEVEVNQMNVGVPEIEIFKNKNFQTSVIDRIQEQEIGQL